ncbi:hypothetical protein [Actinacidiphila yeochonensis]|nr:hypothetical protein [Actinacidiphila yeochonensis]
MSSTSSAPTGTVAPGPTSEQPSGQPSPTRTTCKPVLWWCD